MYNHITLKELRPNLPKVMEKVDSRLSRYIISKHGHPTAILLALDDFESLLETLEEQEDQRNLKRILRGLREAKSGKTTSWKAIKEKYQF